MVTDLVITVDPAKHDVRVKAAEMVLVQSEDPDYRRFAPDPDVAAYVARYEDASRAEAERPVGRLSAPAREDGWENALGNMIADAQLAATRANGAQIAFMNEGGVRTDLVPASDDGTVTFGEIYAVQPFGNVLMTMDLSMAHPQLPTPITLEMRGRFFQVGDLVAKTAVGMQPQQLRGRGIDQPAIPGVKVETNVAAARHPHQFPDQIVGHPLFRDQRVVRCI